MGMLSRSRSTHVQKKPHHGREALKTCRAEEEGKDYHYLLHGVAGVFRMVVQ